MPTLALVIWAQQPPAEPLPISSMQATTSASAQWPGTGAHWVARELPSRGCKPGDAICYDHYQAEFEWRGEPMVLVLTEFVGSVRVYINGQTITEQGSITPPIQNRMLRPAYLRVPQDALELGVNSVQATVTNRPGMYQRLDPFYLTDANHIERYAAAIVWLHRDALVLSIGVMTTMVVLALLLYGLAHSSPLYLWFAAAATFAALRSGFFLLVQPEWEALRVSMYFAGSNLQLVCLVGLIGALLHPEKWRRYVALLFGSAVGVCCLLLYARVDPLTGGFVANVFTYFVFVITAPWIVAGIALHYRDGHSIAGQWALALAMASVMLSLSDLFPILWRQQSANVQLANLAPLPIVVSFAIIAAQRYHATVTALRDAHSQRVLAVENERTRIKRDVHDGVGGRMAGLLMMARREHPTLASHLEASLQELRVILDSLDVSSTGSLSLALEQFRRRLEPWLVDHNLRSSWHINVSEDTQIDRSLQVAILRILQELINNCLRHANATEIELRMTRVGNSFSLEVRDDGEGIGDPSGALFGAGGLGGIRERLSALGGTIDVSTLHPGAQIRVLLPLYAREGEQTHKHGVDFDALES